jgi:hypothetical protein
LDRAYAAANRVKDHQKDIAEYGKDPAMRQFAQETLPTLKHHLQLAHQEMEKAAGSSAGI